MSEHTNTATQQWRRRKRRRRVSQLCGEKLGDEEHITINHTYVGLSNGILKRTQIWFNTHQTPPQRDTKDFEQYEVNTVYALYGCLHY